MMSLIDVLLIVLGLFGAMRPATFVEPGGPWFRWGPAGRYFAPDGDPAVMVHLARAVGAGIVPGGALGVAAGKPDLLPFHGCPRSAGTFSQQK